MKKLFILSLILFSFTTIFAQQEWGNVQKNKVTIKEIAPIWPGCEEKEATEIDDCFNQKLATHISQNFKYPTEAYKKNEQGKVTVDFIINKKGLIEIEKVSGGTKLLQQEAKRNIMSIPKMVKPGMLAGKSRAIHYSVPFNFKTGK